jgi:lysozyme
MHVSQKGIDLITEFEGFSAKAYKDPGSKNGLPITIGYGTTKIDGKSVMLGDKITEPSARALLIKHLETYEDQVREALSPVTVNQNQFDALVSLVYNIGITQFNKSTVKRKIIAGDMIAAANAFGMWVKNDGNVMAGLVRRRAAEQASNQV